MVRIDSPLCICLLENELFVPSNLHKPSNFLRSVNSKAQGLKKVPLPPTPSSSVFIHYLLCCPLPRTPWCRAGWHGPALGSGEKEGGHCGGVPGVGACMTQMQGDPPWYRYCGAHTWPLLPCHLWEGVSVILNQKEGRCWVETLYIGELVELGFELGLLAPKL